jgi:hypothetical protein
MSLHIGLSSTSFSLLVHLDLTDCPPRADGEEPEQPPQSGGKAKRLPREVKQKLAKVARLAVSCMCSSLFWECLCFYSKHVKTCAK